MTTEPQSSMVHVHNCSYMYKCMVMFSIHACIVWGKKYLEGLYTHYTSPMAENSFVQGLPSIPSQCFVHT